MANSALIDELRKQFAENPRRVFARLANEYRKRGELDSAIEICRNHVPLQPGYISGHIVLGQALYDSGSMDEARTTFETALALDPENLIALRHMGDIARATGDVTGALSWYRQLLEIDPQNEDVASQLDTLSAGGATPAADRDVGANGSMGWGEVNPEAIELLAEGPSADVPPAGLAAPERLAEGTTDVEVAAEAFSVVESELEIMVEGVEVSEPVEMSAGVDVLFVGDAPEATSDAETATADLAPVEPVEVELLAPDSSEDVFEVMEEAEPASRAVPPLYPPDPYAATTHDLYDHADAAPSAFATETVAELYLQQGLPDRALAIYRDLAARSPEDASLRERVAELEEASAVAPPPTAASERPVRTAREFFGVLAYRRAPRGSGTNEAATELFADGGGAVSAADDGAATLLREAFGTPASTDRVGFTIDDLMGTTTTVAHSSNHFDGASESVSDGVSDGVSNGAGDVVGEDAVSEKLEEDEESTAQDVGTQDVGTIEASIESSLEAPVEAGEAVEATGDDSGAARSTHQAEVRAGKPGREANDALSLDDVFRDPTARGDSRRESGVSFDEFFARREHGGIPEGSNGAFAAESDENGVNGQHVADDAPQDLELFHAWLDGLKS